ncbi:MAG: VanZ family protein [Bacteroidota bacterium]|nr:MAG: VanZ family protein [Bacteroidota bacterium]
MLGAHFPGKTCRRFIYLITWIRWYTLPSFVFQCLWTAFFRTRGIGLILILAIAYGFFLEYYQSHFVKGRSFDVWDGVADTLGAFCCVLWTKHPKCKQNVNH